MRDFRKHTNWYMSGYPVGPEVRRQAVADLLVERARRHPRRARSGDRDGRRRRAHQARPHQRPDQGVAARALPRRPRRARRSPTTTTSWHCREADADAWLDAGRGDPRSSLPSVVAAAAGVAARGRVSSSRSCPPTSTRSPRPDEKPVDYVERVARDKAMAVVAKLGIGAAGDVVVLAADTTVDVDGDVLGKPADDDDARRMLRLLSGRTHQVHTAVGRRGGSPALEHATVDDGRHLRRHRRRDDRLVRRDRRAPRQGRRLRHAGRGRRARRARRRQSHAT